MTVTPLWLSTESAANVPFYQHFGYRILGDARISDELETWVFVRERSQRMLTYDAG